ncbi:MAG: hypothetical protein IK079_00270 [Desulfovibrio sp.]|nr:hypothetical protein [Desulfovibrio sp.]
MFSMMLFLFFGFLGITALLVYLLICQDRQSHVLRDEHAQLRVLLRSMESRVASLESLLCGKEGKKKRWDAEKESLLSLDFSGPSETKAKTDPNLDLHLN